LAAAVGAEILERGGNAIDAAVAVGFALAAVLPEAGNIGGGGFLVYRGADGEVRALDFRERAPLAASRDMYLDERGEPTDRSLVGHLAAGVPGAVAGLWAMHQELGSLPWSELVEPAVELARGHPVDATRHQHLIGAADLLRRFPGSAGQFLPGGAPPPAGSVWSQPDLAGTLAAIRDEGRDGFYRGRVAALLVAEMEAGGGLVAAADLDQYTAMWRTPVVANYRDIEIFAMPPPSSGGVTLAMILNILEGFQPLPPFGTPELVHLQAEAMRRAFIERNRTLGDPDFVELPMARLQSEDFAAQLRAEIALDAATPTPPFLPESSEGSNTTHYSIVDAAGNAAAITTTLNSAYGSGVVVRGAGFLLNNEMDDFAAAPGRPNQFGLVEGESNAVAPGKRMLSSMAPTILVDGSGQLLAVIGSPGGPTIITTVFQVASNLVDHGMTAAQSVESPRVHHQALPDRIYFEAGSLSADTVRRLEAMGHTLQERDGYSGDVAAVFRVEGGWLAVADPRRGGGVAVARGSLEVAAGG
jgi:gamma-glutamyltranspeptidase/glutathione hydrolase